MLKDGDIMIDSRTAEGYIYGVAVYLSLKVERALMGYNPVNKLFFCST